MDTNTLWAEYKAQPNTLLKKKIILSYTNLVHYVIHHSKFATMNIFDDRDYFQFGIEGLNEAVDRFDPDFGTKFETYAIQRIRGKIIDELRKAQIKPRILSREDSNQVQYSNVSLNQPINQEDGSMLYEVLPADVETPDFETEKIEAKEKLIEAIKNLNERDRMIITLYYFEHLSYKEIADVLDISVSRISQIHSKIIENLKSMLGDLND
ncbi:MAG: RNA polymerase subunit sigma [Ignavibacteriae bacterium HGW-Ignavibacteriae-2]|nr:sigma-70 family RNA polymerase sigma factor [Bacteroidota bacterium]PKL89272.1 MAG: RNA polymerase subunit sigma [Ignavibacteriae bacterium HGW-Ignavibacteriae-2]